MAEENKPVPDEQDELFGSLCIEQGYLTPEQVEEAKAAQEGARELGMHLALPDVVLSKKMLTEEQCEEVRRVLRVQTGEARIVGDYEVAAKIGGGGMGVVYKARSLTSGEMVALKVLPPSLARNSKLLERFRREAQITRMLKHENIVRCVELGTDRKRKLHYCALELVEGEDVAKIIGREGRMEEAKALDIVRQVAGAIRHASEHGLIHRDIKPQNIMVTPGGTAKLLDLGLARNAGDEESQLTQTGMFVGSPHYASPEQARGEREIDVRTDIYSLGATLYHMVTGRTPFEGDSSAAVLTKVVSDRADWPADINPGLSNDVCRVIEKMMARDRNYRYQAPLELLHDVEAVTAGGRATCEAPPRSASIFRRPAEALARRSRTTGAHARVTGGRPAGKNTAVVVVLLLLVGGGAAGGAGFFMLRGGDGKRPDTVADVPVPVVEEVPSGAAGVEERAAQAREMLDFARNYAGEHPDEYARVLSYYEKALKAAAGTVVEMEADSEIAELKKRRRQAVDAVLQKALREARELAAKGEIDAALAVLQDSPQLEQEAMKEAIEEATAIAGKAGSDMDDLMSSAEKAVAAGDLKGARSALGKLDGISYAERSRALSGRRAAVLAGLAGAEKAADARKKTEAAGKLEALLDDFFDRLGKQDLDGAEQEMKAAAADKGLAPVAEETGAAAGVASALINRRRAMEAAAGRMAGQDVSIGTTKGVRKGRLEEATPEGILLAVKIIIMGQERGETKYMIAWDELSRQEEDRLAAGWNDGSAGCRVAEALLALWKKDYEAAGAALEKAKGHPLHGRTASMLELAQMDAVEAEAAAAWKEIGRKAGQSKLTAAEAKALIAKADEYEKTYSQTAFGASKKKEIEDIRRRARDYYVEWADLPAERLQVQLAGAAESSSANGTLTVNVPQAKGNHAHIPLPFDCSDFRLKFEYSGRLLEMSLRKPGPDVKGSVLALFGTDVIAIRAYPREDPQGAHTVLRTNRKDIIAPGWHSMELALQGNQLTILLDGKFILQNERLPVVGSGDGLIYVWPANQGPFHLRNMSYAIMDKDYDGGLFTGLVTAKGPDWVEVKLPGEDVAKRYVPPDDGRGGVDAAVTAAIKGVVAPNIVKMSWKRQGGQRRVTGIEVLLPATKTGTVTGTLTDMGPSWVEIRPDDGPVEQYWAHWVGGNHGGPDQAVVQAITGLKWGDRVRVDWTYDVRKRIDRIVSGGGTP
ncbi:MAG: protein kinase [Planctomycetes bacterium]|nr:protein kinase [Planctomycetota bacterium]